MEKTKTSFWQKIKDLFKKSELNDEFTRNDLIKVCCVIGLAFLLWNGLSFSWDKVSCAYKGSTMKKREQKLLMYISTSDDKQLID